jgi:hypothetical protein
MKPIRLIVYSGLLVVLACSSVQAATFIVPGDFGTIQGAIADVGTVNGDEIVVQPGTYPEAINFLGKAITVRSASGDPNNTIIDGAGFFHVVQCVSGEDPNTVLYGFTIRGGEAAGISSPDDVGGGMYNLNSSPTVTNCIFTENHAKISGGGLKGEGGGMYNDQSHPIVTDCTFELNSAEKSGGGMYNNKSNSIVTDCTFSFNSAGLSGMGFGGGLYNFKSSSTVTNCVFIGNSGANGGGMHNSGGNPMVTSCTFSDNLADSEGGGMFAFNSRPTVFYCKFISNTAINGGGMSNRHLSTPNVTNCIFSRNLALDGNGAGMSNAGKCNPVVVNCTFSDNKITSNPAGGGGMSNELSSSPTVTNTIFWGNLPEQVSYEPNSIRHIIYSLVQGGSTGIGNIDDDPNFVDAFSDDLHLQAGSPAIDAGSNAVSCGPWDLDGNNRFIDDPNTEDTGMGRGDIVDIGAYEFGASKCLCDNGLVGDINCDGIVDRLDVRLLNVHWLEKI